MLVQAVCVPGEAEPAAVAALAAALGLDAEAVAEELLYLRAFAIDFAVLMALGDSPAKDQIQTRYYEHWTRIDQQAGGQALRAMEERLQEYAMAVGASAHGQGGLAAQVGQSLALRCGAGEGPDAAELAVFGGRLFAALYDEVVALLTDVEIVLLEE